MKKQLKTSQLLIGKCLFCLSLILTIPQQLFAKTCSSGGPIASRCQKPPSLSQKLGNSELQIFLKVWHEINYRHAFLAERGVDWNCAFWESFERLGKNPVRSQIRSEMEIMLRKLKDGHTFLDSKRMFEYGSKDLAKKGSLLSSIFLDEGSKTLAQGEVQYGQLKEEPELGYLRVDSMEEPVLPSHLSKALKALSPQSKGIIVDLRFNGGGYDSTALSLMGHFTKTKILSHYKAPYFRNEKLQWQSIFIQPRSPFIDLPIVFLIGSKTRSAAEIGAIAARALRSKDKENFISIGDFTEGITSDIVQARIGSFTIGFSGERYVGPSCEVFEVAGVGPDLFSSSATTGASLAKRIENFERHINKSLKSGKDSDVVQAIEWLNKAISN